LQRTTPAQATAWHHLGLIRTCGLGGTKKGILQVLGQTGLPGLFKTRKPGGGARATITQAHTPALLCTAPSRHG
jgi:hypothetical protein